GPLTAKLSVSGIAEQSTFERGEVQHLRVTSPALTTRGEVARSASEYAGLRDVAWKTGVEVVSTHHVLDVAVPAERREGEPPAPDDAMDTSTKYKGTVDTSNLAGWTSVEAALDSRVKFSTGLRVDAYTRANDVAVQPRGELQFKLRKDLTLRTAAGG